MSEPAETGCAGWTWRNGEQAWVDESGNTRDTNPHDHCHRLIASFRAENARLKSDLSAANARVGELEGALRRMVGHHLKCPWNDCEEDACDNVLAEARRLLGEEKS